LIKPKFESIQEYILNGFDLSVVKNYLYRQDEGYKLYTHKLEDIANKNINMDTDSSLINKSKIDKRVSKYINYGFRINSDDVMKDAQLLEKIEYAREYKVYVKYKKCVKNTNSEKVSFKYIAVQCHEDCHLLKVMHKDFVGKYKHLHVVKEDRLKKIYCSSSEYMNGADTEHIPNMIMYSDVVIFSL
jgi:hypothetical protein